MSDLQSLVTSMGMHEFQTHFNPSEFNPLTPWEFPVDSTCLSKVGYNPLTLKLFVTFTDGVFGSYLNVSYTDFWALVTNASVGKYFNLYIRNLHEWIPGDME